MQIGFLIYDSRSGSTLLASLLNAHPEIFVSLEAEYIVGAMKFWQKNFRFPVNEEFRQILNEDRRLAEWDFEWPQLFDRLYEEEGSVSVQKFTEAILKEAAEADSSETKIAFLKQGLLSDYLHDLRKAWRGAFFIHIYRDGRAVFASKKRSVNVDSQEPMAVDPVQSARRWMRVQENVNNIFGNGPLMEVRYEELVQNETAVLQSIWKFLGVALLDPEHLAGTEYASRIPDSQKGIHQLVGKEPDPSRMEAWQKELTIKEVWQYETIAKKWLSKRGYTPITRNIAGMTMFLMEKLKNRVSAGS